MHRAMTTFTEHLCVSGLNEPSSFLHIILNISVCYHAAPGLFPSPRFSYNRTIPLCVTKFATHIPFGSICAHISEIITALRTSQSVLGFLND